MSTPHFLFFLFSWLQDPYCLLFFSGPYHFSLGFHRGWSPGKVSTMSLAGRSRGVTGGWDLGEWPVFDLENDDQASTLLVFPGHFQTKSSWNHWNPQVVGDFCHPLRSCLSGICRSPSEINWGGGEKLEIDRTIIYHLSLDIYHILFRRILT